MNFNKTEQPAAHWLFFFRLNIPLIALVHFLSIQGNFNDFYSFKAYVYPDIMNASYDHYSFTIISLKEFLHRMHINISYDSLLTICRICYPSFLVLLLIGCFTRVSAILSLFFQLLMIKSIYMYEYGADYFTTIALFYCCIFPVGKIFSVDNIIFKKRKPVNHTIYLNLLKAHLCIAYFFSGFDKLLGASWRNGEAVWKSLHSHNYYSIINLDFLANTPFFHISGWATIITEMLYPVFMNIKKSTALLADLYNRDAPVHRIFHGPFLFFGVNDSAKYQRLLYTALLFQYPVTQMIHTFFIPRKDLSLKNYYL